MTAMSDLLVAGHTIRAIGYQASDVTLGTNGVNPVEQLPVICLETLD